MRTGKKSGTGRPLLGLLVGAAGALAAGRVWRRHRYDVLSMLRRTFTAGGRRSRAQRRADGTAG